MRALAAVVLVSFVALGIATLYERGFYSGPGFALHEGVAGPDQESVVPPAETTAVARYGDGAPSRLAILLTDERASAWLGFVAALKARGIPVTVTTDWRSALAHRMVLVYPTLTGAVLDRDAIRALARHPLSGGTVVAFSVLGGGLGETFGFEGEPAGGRQRYAMTFSAAAQAANGLSGPLETTIPLGRRGSGAAEVGTYGYTPRHPDNVEASFDDGSAAIVGRALGPGHAYAVGLDFGDYALRGFNQRNERIARSYANGYEPAMDVLMRWVVARYRAAEPLAVTLGTTPGGRELPVIITHDIDARRSVRNALDYARYEQKAGVPATYFIQTKYVRDWNDDVFFDAEGVATLRELVTLGHDLGSHSVAHSNAYSSESIGTGRERYPDYRPFVRNSRTCEGCSILGELRVSGFLIERLLGARPSSFRPGHLSTPPLLPDAMEATGYRYSSFATANNTLTHLPFRLRRERGATSESTVFEFPITIEDEHKPPLPKRLPQAIALAEDVARNEGVYVVLIHTESAGAKLEFEQKLVEALRPRAWFGSLDQFGRWWVARDAVALDVAREAGGVRLIVEAPQRIEGLTLRVPEGWQPRAGETARLIAPGQLLLPVLQGRHAVRLIAPDAESAR